MEIDVRITLDADPKDWSAEDIIQQEDEILEQVFSSVPIMVRKAVILRNDGYGNLLPDEATERSR